MTILFSVDRTVITKHIGNVFREGEVDEKSKAHCKFRSSCKIYSLDVIIYIGYRVKSKRGVKFCKWANTMLKQYILQGYAVNNNCISRPADKMCMLL